MAEDPPTLETTESAVSCRFWDYSSCRGTPACPPRCPRFVDDDGRPLVIHSPEDHEVPRGVDHTPTQYSG